MSYEILSLRVVTLRPSTSRDRAAQLTALARVRHESGAILTLSRMVNSEIRWIMDSQTGTHRTFSAPPGSRDRVLYGLKGNNPLTGELNTRLKETLSA